MPENRVSDIITHVTLNIINGAVVWVIIFFVFFLLLGGQMIETLFQYQKEYKITRNRQKE